MSLSEKKNVILSVSEGSFLRKGSVEKDSSAWRPQNDIGLGCCDSFCNSPFLFDQALETFFRIWLMRPEPSFSSKKFSRLRVEVSTFGLPSQ